MYEECRKIEYTNFQPRGITAASAIAELAKAAQGAPRVSFREVVLCKDCTCKKAVSIGRVMVWRCPYSTVDVELDGYCHRGVKRNEDLGRS